MSRSHPFIPLLVLALLSGVFAPRGRSTDAAPPDPDPLEAEIQALRAELHQRAGNEVYLVIDTVHNRLQIRRANQVLGEASCATGSAKVLLGPRRKSWSFQTPRRIFQIRRKVEDPIWVKPEWAFVEKGERPPVLPQDFSRFDLSTLGKYALEMGDGFEIHGTLYPNLIGRHITHGCIRLNDEDLETVYTQTRVGTRIYVY